ncbi:MAG TPA: gliding motility-associated C-terminal domain-containing protein [Flavisolibacter sp.]|nr:gliding motility-associated C-terminal domain-containing protein [Flavisolibacter sp.]
MYCVRILLCLILLLGTASGFCQGENNNWYFSVGAGISFNSGSAVAVSGGVMGGGEGAASISDAAGNLLFYTDGLTIWNRNHTPMPNGTGLAGHNSTTQPALIIPYPGNDKQYYIFTLDDLTTLGKLHYSIVDMTLDGGKGDIVAGSKNIFLGSGYMEMMASASATQCGIWVIVHRRLSSTFEAWLVSAAGIGTPVVSDAGTSVSFGAGVMKVSRNNKLIGFASTTDGFCEVLDFNPATGIVTGGINLPTTPGLFPYGLSFSPDNTKLYYSEGKVSNSFGLYQHDLSLPTPAQVRDSRTLIDQVSTREAAFAPGDMAIGPDNRIYVCRTGMTCLGVINNPNAAGPACDFVESGFCFPTSSTFVSLGLPNEIRLFKKVAELALGADSILCAGNTVTLNAPPAPGNILWSTGETTPSITAGTSGKYWVSVTDGACQVSDTILLSFSGHPVKLGADTVLCEGTTHTLQPSRPFVSYTWQDNSTGPSLNAAGPGLYWLEAVNECGIASRDSLVITELKFSFELGPTRTICSTEPLRLDGPSGFTNYTWGPNYNIDNLNAQTVTVNPSVDTAYVLIAEKQPGCFARDTIRVLLREGTVFELGRDTAVCPGQTVVLSAPPGFSSYSWSNGSTSSATSIQNEGLVWLQATSANGCRSRDSLVVSWQPCGIYLWVPSAFTPNNDGLNDRLRIVHQGLLEEFELRIYNRWGKIVHQTKDPSAAWDGSYKGADLDTGVYIWTCNYKFNGQDRSFSKGTVTIIR